MTAPVRLLLTALAAVAAENILFTGGVGFSRVLRAARRPVTMGWYSLLVMVFSLISILSGMALAPLFSGSAALIVLRPALFAFCTAAAYLAAAFLLKSFLPGFYRKIDEILSPAAINTVVLSMPYVQRNFAFDPAQAVGYAVGTGAAFFLAANILARAAVRCKNEDVPKAFGGLPDMLIYIGILSLAFAGFTGGKLF